MHFLKVSALLGFAGAVMGIDHGPTYGGSGPYKSFYFEDATLPNHTLYMPLQSAFGTDNLALPVIIWGNGGCIKLGLRFRAMLGEVASHGALVITQGPASVDPETYVNETLAANLNVTTSQSPDELTTAIDWIIEKAGQPGRYKNVDASRERLAVWGQSCGGLEAYTAGAHDDRVNHLGIFNSGQLNDAASESVASQVKKPIFYFLGGPTDIAYVNGERDYSDLPLETPKFMANHDLGHSASFDLPDAGPAGVAGKNLLNWVLRGNETAKDWFTAYGWEVDGYTDAKYENLDSIVPRPIQ